MGLRDYNKKRNFKSTPEPPGDEGPRARKGALRFVVQLHDASRKHYDVRLELDGTMKSWAVPKGPSTDPLERRLAVEVEDHPIAYNDFEGIIPAGNYGAGVVMIWDEGTYTARAVEFPAKDEADALRRGLAKGHLTVVLEGSKLKGEFALIRLAKGGPGNWLMVKKHDKFAARTEITHADRSARSGRTLGEIAATAGKEGKIWHSRPKEPAPAKTKQKKIIAKASAPRAALPPKFKKKAKAEASPEPGKPPVWLPAAAAPSAAGLVIQPFFDGYRAQVVIGEGGDVRLAAKTGSPLTKRFPALVTALEGVRGPLKLDGLIVALDAEGSPRRRGQGAGAKPAGAASPATYAFFAYDLLHADGRDLSALPLKDRLAALDALDLRHAALVVVSAKTPDDAAIGGLARPADDPYAVTTARTFRAGGGVRSRLPPPKEEAATVLSTAKMPGSRHEVVGRSRDKARPAPPRPAVPQLALTNLQKIFWPDERYTKGDLIDYYRTVAPLMVPHLAGRPQSLNRHPNGIKGTSFFQKEVAGSIPGWMETATIASGRSGKVVTYALVQSAADLLCLANMGCIEINTWLSRVPHVNRPDYVVFDLDPGSVPFEAVVDAARVVKKIMDAIGAPAFCKTSGGRGLHVYVPITGAESFDEARLFVELVSREIHRLLPETTSLERSPARRTHRIYLDFLQNRIGQTMAAVYSARPRPGACVSVPLKWTEVKKGLDPSVFTIKTAPARFAKLGDLWAGIHAAAAPLPKLQKALEHYLKEQKAPLSR